MSFIDSTFPEPLWAPSPVPGCPQGAEVCGEPQVGVGRCGKGSSQREGCRFCGAGALSHRGRPLQGGSLRQAARAAEGARWPSPCQSTEVGRAWVLRGKWGRGWAGVSTAEQTEEEART